MWHALLHSFSSSTSSSSCPKVTSHVADDSSLTLTLPCNPSGTVHVQQGSQHLIIVPTGSLCPLDIGTTYGIHVTAPTLQLVLQHQLTEASQYALTPPQASPLDELPIAQDPHALSNDVNRLSTFIATG